MTRTASTRTGGPATWRWPCTTAYCTYSCGNHREPCSAPLKGRRCRGGDLRHAVFDGTTWHALPPFAMTPGAEQTQLTASRRGAALASFDGKLHAVYPAVHSNRLIHRTWTVTGGGWTAPVALEGHDSNNTPALLPFREGPSGVERQALLLVHRGIDRYTPPMPPEPPKPPALKDVKNRGTEVTGELLTAYGAGDWSRLEHQFSLTPATMKNGDPALIVTFEAWAQYLLAVGLVPRAHRRYVHAPPQGRLLPEEG